MKNIRLKKELLRSKATEDELDELLELADMLKATPKVTLSPATKAKIKAISGGKRRWPAITALSLAGSMAVFVAVLVTAQFATPGSPLYGIKKGSEQIRALIQPSYKKTIVEIRKQELETLESQHAPTSDIDKAVESYEKALERSEKSTPQPETPSTERFKPRQRENRNDSYNNTRSDRYQNGYKSERDSTNSWNSWDWRRSR